MSKPKKKKVPKIEPYIPIFHRPPNKFVKYTIESFHTGGNSGGKIRVAHFIDKNGNEKSCTAQVMWEYMWGEPYIK
jgi:hypothetical protein